MAPIRKAKSYVTYLVALLVSGFFSLLGRPSPAWAEETRGNANVYKGNYVVAQSTTTLNATRKTWPAQGMEIQPGLSPAVQLENVGQVTELLKQIPASTLNRINAKLQNQEPLDVEESALFLSIKNEQAVADLQQKLLEQSNQINLLLMTVKDLKAKLESK